ncbi:MAG: hypothetical protein G01um101448_1042 [Parcubacteria group bacterium Gr01-1014_48]|nr:MAG: hypothetical protein Greene041614_116 [Parcubacteria group bacterium Greene0416_14]TSC72078.1 MAG: hypothetical protein G01um101448_1042 [Parcubacteria group bacterium Gr01-1014_48]TSC99743.1 MAG: hypothetical protein Greene101415_1104 [Parcubacteria group bacterium Greene1014_15]TSD07041.1 MAG: hypothetical protein Greene07144_1018 [Parcubacteria group bacterium Greene0714_4]
MTLSEIPAVKIVSSDGYKYLVAELTGADGNKKFIVRADYSDSHKIIATRLEKEVGRSINIRYHGGGYISIYHEPWEDRFTHEAYPGKQISIFGTSDYFGMDSDPDRTVALLQKAFPGYSIEHH